MENKHIGDIFRVIDEALLEEEIVLEALQRAVEQNGMPEAQAAADFAAFKGDRHNPEHSELYYVWLASHRPPITE